MNTPTARIKLTQAIGDKALWDVARDRLLTIVAGDALDIQLGIFDPTDTDAVEGTPTDLATITLEIYASRTATATIMDAVATASIVTLTAPNWTAGTHQNATLSLSGTVTNVAMERAARHCWATIYGIRTDDGERVNLGSGPVLLLRSAAGGDGPTETPEALYPTNAQMAALLAGMTASRIITATLLSGAQTLTLAGADAPTGTEVVTAAAMARNDDGLHYLGTTPADQDTLEFSAPATANRTVYVTLSAL